MAENLFKVRNQLKDQWVAANRHALELRKRAAEAEQKAAALQRALDALEKAAPESMTEERSVGRGSRNGIRNKIVEALREKGPMTAHNLAEAVGASYWAVLSHLKKGPFKQGSRSGDDGKSARFWLLAQAEDGFGLTEEKAEAAQE